MAKTRTKLYVEFPLAKNLKEAVKFMENGGGGVWQECGDDFPQCGGFDSVEDLLYDFPKEEWDYEKDEQNLFLHLVPAGHENDEAEPFRVGERVWATKSQDSCSKGEIIPGICYKIIDINSDGDIKLDEKKCEDIWWDANKFCRCVLPVDTEKIYILTNLHGGRRCACVYRDLEFLKEERGLDIIWSDEYKDLEALEKKLAESCNRGRYSRTNWSIEGIDPKTTETLYGIEESFLRTR